MEVEKKRLTLNYIIVVIIIFNLLDLVLTYYGLQLAYVYEVNPLMRLLYNFDPLFFVIVKAALPTVLLIFISRHVHKIKYSEYPLTFLFLLYSGLMFLHFKWIYYLLSW